MSKRGVHSNLMGRPSKYKSEYGDQLVVHCKGGGFIGKFATEIGVTKETLLAWTEKYPDFSDSYKKARQAQEDHFLELGYGLATGQVKGQVAAWCFMMKNMFGWRDVSEMKVDQTSKKKLVIVMGDDDEA